MSAAQHWTTDEWSSILFYASIAREPRPLPVHGLTARGASAYAARRLRNLAIQTEIRGVAVVPRGQVIEHCPDCVTRVRCTVDGCGGDRRGHLAEPCQ